MDSDYRRRDDSRLWFSVVVITLVLILGAIAFVLSTNSQNPINPGFQPGVGGGPPTEQPATFTPTPTLTPTPSPIPY